MTKLELPIKAQKLTQLSVREALIWIGRLCRGAIYEVYEAGMLIPSSKQKQSICCNHYWKIGKTAMTQLWTANPKNICMPEFACCFIASHSPLGNQSSPITITTGSVKRFQDVSYVTYLQSVLTFCPLQMIGLIFPLWLFSLRRLLI